MLTTKYKDLEEMLQSAEQEAERKQREAEQKKIDILNALATKKPQEAEETWELYDPDPNDLLPLEEVKLKENRKRNKRISVRWTEEEYEKMQKRRSTSGLGQEEFIRRLALHGRITVRQQPEADDLLICEISAIRGKLGSLGGLLMLIRRACDEQRWYDDRFDSWMVQTRREVAELREHILKMEERLNGNR